MTGKRQFGAVRKLPSGRWQARYRTADGRLSSAPLTFKTKGDAGRWLSSVEADKARGVWLDPSAGRVHLAEYAAAWLQGKATLAPRTREIYSLQLRLHILPAIEADVPALGAVPLGQISPDLVRAWYAALVAQRGRSVAAKAYVRLRQILNQAVNDDRIAKNPYRVASAADHGTGTGSLSGRISTLADEDQRSVRSRIASLPNSIGLIGPRTLIPVMAGLRAPRLNYLSAEALAILTESTIAVRTDSPPLREASTAFHIAYRVVDAP